MSLDFNDDQPTLVQLVAWCCQATSHYLSKYWPRSLSPYGVTRPQLVNTCMCIFRYTTWNAWIKLLSARCVIVGRPIPSTSCLPTLLQEMSWAGILWTPSARHKYPSQHFVIWCRKNITFHMLNLWVARHLRTGFFHGSLNLELILEMYA